MLAAMVNVDSYIHIFCDFNLLWKKEEKEKQEVLHLKSGVRDFFQINEWLRRLDRDSNGAQTAEMDSRQGKAWKTKNDLALNCDG